MTRSLCSLSRRWSWLKRHPAFIAAPLLGTIIFLACVIFIINLNKVESANVVLAEGDAYHNRIVSLLEMYRSDTASLFRQQITFVIENYLTSQCWLNLFDIDNSKPEATNGNPDYENEKIVRLPGGSTPGSDQDYTMEELRYAKCKYVNRIINYAARSFYSCKSRCVRDPSRTDPGNCPHLTLKDCREQFQPCIDCEAKLYGLPKIMRDLSGETTFEGITFNASNYNEFKFLFDDPDGTSASTFTTTLLGGSLFDCGAYARTPPGGPPKFQCCSVSGDMFDTPESYEYDYEHDCDGGGRSGTVDGKSVASQVVPGCGDGSFFVKISLLNNVVYPVMPRFHADDAVGNQLRTGALGENDFYLPISYPLYKYLDYAFEIYENLANGDKNDPNEGASEGIAQGLCAQGTADSNQQGSVDGSCAASTGFLNDQGFDPSPECKTQVECEASVQKAFIENRLKDACDKFDGIGGTHHSEAVMYVCTKNDVDVAGAAGKTACSDAVDSWTRTCGRENPDPARANDKELFAVHGSDPKQIAEQLATAGSAFRFAPTSETHCNSDPNKYAVCSYLNTVVFAVRFNDLSGEHQVDPDNQNRLCAFIRIQHKKS
jgi:hypothetical protein